MSHPYDRAEPLSPDEQQARIRAAHEVVASLQRQVDDLARAIREAGPVCQRAWEVPDPPFKSIQFKTLADRVNSAIRSLPEIVYLRR